MNNKYFCILLFSILFNNCNKAEKRSTESASNQEEDVFLWLEEVESDKSLDWVRAQNKKTLDILEKYPKYEEIKDNCLKVYNSKEKIEYPGVHGKFVYNFWKDENSIRGLWRRTSKKDYLDGNPNWEIILDLDKLSKEENKKWVWKGASGLKPEYNKFLITLSDGGSDANVIREFDMSTKSFVKDGFQLPESKGSVSWWDENTLFLSRDFGEGTLTTSGYPRQLKKWTRGTQLSDAELIYEIDKEKMGLFEGVINRNNDKYVTIYEMNSFYSSSKLIYKNGVLTKLNLPDDADFSGFFKGQAIVSLKSDYKVNGKIFEKGSLVAMGREALMNDSKDKKVSLIYKPTAKSSLGSFAYNNDKIIINVLDNIVSKLYTVDYVNGTWNKERINAPDFGSISVFGMSEDSNDYFFTFSNFLTPRTLYYGNTKTNDFQKIDELPNFFDASKYEVKQLEATSKDGTKIPYFLIANKQLKKDGNNPTLLYAYGGFESSMTPSYSATRAISWLNYGGVYVLANIRGGGEFGPAWHQAGLKEKRQNVYDDFHAVAEDLIDRNITSPQKLGIQGGSNGGLLMGVAFTQRPDLYNAVLCEVPLLDMKRYNKLLAGASWMGEYGNPDIPEEWEYIKKYSPYQNLKKGENYPEVFFTTSTKDDRVHPAHARKMSAKMNEMGYKTYYHENIEGGHGGASTNEQFAESAAREYSYLMMKLMVN